MRLGNIQNTNNIKFSGYDARPLASIAITHPGYKCEIARQLEQISKVANFKVDILTGNKLENLEYIDELILTSNDENAEKKPRGFKPSKGTTTWAQDINILTPKGYIVANPAQMTLARSIGQKYKKKTFMDYMYLPGGNAYFVRGKNGKDELLVGKHEKRKLCDVDSKDIDYQHLKNVYGVSKVTFLPQMDFHIDLAIRPLDNKRILLADDRLTMKIIQEGKDKITKAIENAPNKSQKDNYEKILEKLENLEWSFLTTALSTKFSKSEKMKKILKANGFEVIPVPGRIYSTSYGSLPSHKLNYMNGIAVINDNDELVYITNKSNVDIDLGITKQIADELDFSFEKAFKNSISDYVKPENIFFVSGLYDEIADTLEVKKGGIHCMITEIPRNIVKNC